MQVLAGFLAVSAAGCGGRARTGERPLEVLVAQDAESLDPRFTMDTVGLRVTRLMHAGLFRLDEGDLHPVPYAAKGVLFQSPEELVVELRTDITFHSGKPLVAEDVVATFTAIADKSVGSRHARIFDAIDRVTADSAHVVRFHMKRPHATLLTDLEMPILRADQAFGPPDSDGDMDGIGPYRLARRTEGEMSLVPAKDSALGKTPAHPITIRVVHDENARALRLLSGSGDMVQNGFSLSLIPALAKEPGLTVHARPGANLTYLLFRTDRGPLADVALRRAVGQMLDRELVGRTLLSGHATVATTVLPEGHWAHTTRPAGAMTFDPEVAEAAITALGRRGTKLELLTSTDRLRSTVARFFAQTLNARGLDVTVRELELGTLIARLNAGDFDMCTLQLPELAEPNALRFFLHSTYIPPEGGNRGRVHDVMLDTLFDDGDHELLPEKRRVIYQQIEEQLARGVYLVPLWHEDQVAVTGPRAATYQPSPEGRWLGLTDVR